MYSVQDVPASFLSLKMTCQSDKSSSIWIHLYLFQCKRLQNIQKKNKIHSILPFFFSTFQSPLGCGDSGQCSQSPQLRASWPMPCMWDPLLLFLDARESKPKQFLCREWRGTVLLKGAECSMMLPKGQGYSALFPWRHAMLLSRWHWSFAEEPTGKQRWPKN